MKKLLFVMLISSTAFLSASSVFVKRGECAWCPSHTCYGSCSLGCRCMTIGGQTGGTCVSNERVSEWERFGAWELK